MSNPGGIDLNVSPYYDDYDEDKKFARILFRPGRAVQARELTQLQTLLQAQIKRFGNYFFKEGAIVDGCERSYDINVPFVKLQSTFSAANVDVTNFSSKEVVGANTGVLAFVNEATDATTTDPKSLFMTYLSSGSYVVDVASVPGNLIAGNTVYQVSSNSYGTLLYWDSNLRRIYVDNVVGTIDPANTVLLITNSLGANVVVSVTNYRDKRNSKEFENNETLFTNTVTRFYANTQTTGANTHTVNGVTYTRGSKITIGDGIVYISDHFVKNTSQTIILDKYTNTPSYKIGFIPNKTFIDYSTDGTLVDNAQGTPNFQSPGADRLKIDTQLVKYTLTDENTDPEFIPVLNVDNGTIIKRKSFELESKLGDIIAKRTFEESGDYTVNTPKINIREHLLQNANGGRYPLAEGGDNNLLLVEVDPFIAYVKGYRNEILNKSSIPIKKGSETQYVNQSKLQVNYGNYVLVNEIVGAWNVMSATKVDLYNAATNAITDREFGTTSAAGSKIGEARVKSIEYVSGTVGTSSAQYKLYLFDVRMNSGQSFDSVRSVFDGSESVKKAANIILDELGRAVLKETSYNTSLFKLPQTAVKTLRDQENNVDTSFTFKKEFAVSFSTAGVGTISSGDNNEKFVGNGFLSSSQKDENYELVLTANVETNTLGGTVSVGAGSNTVTGSLTSFTSQLSVGETIKINGEIHIIQTITNNTSLVLRNNHSVGASGVTYTKVFREGSYINLSGNGGAGAARTMLVSGSGGTSLTLDLKESTSGFSAKLLATVVRINAKEIKKKLQTNVSTHIIPNTHPNGLQGPFPIGKSDAYRLRGIYQSVNFTTSATTASANVTSQYVFDNGQRDTTYEHATIRPNVGVTPTGRLLVVFDYFEHDTSQGVGYSSVDSYPIDDTGVTANTITTSTIPTYVSTTSGTSFALRDCVDFRIKKTNASTDTNPTDPGTYQVPSGGLHTPIALSSFDADLLFYKSKIAKLFINEIGELGVAETGAGVAETQVPPSIPGTLDIAIINIPPYPSVPKDVVFEQQNNRRYTMKDIGKIEERINRLEYYTSLNILEKQATDVSILDEDGIDRFKNGILVDPFTGHNVADVDNADLKMSISRRDKYATARTLVNQVPLKFKSSASSSNLVRTKGNKIMLRYTDTLFSENPFATESLQLSFQNYNDFTGSLSITPSVDGWMDTTNYVAKTIVNDIEGNSDNWRKIQNAWETEVDAWQTRWIGVPIQQDISPLRTDVSRIIENNYSQHYDVVTSSLSVGPTEKSSQARLVDVSANHYMRTRDYIFFASGMKRTTSVYAFFDGIDVTSNCKMITLQSSKTIADVFNLLGSNDTLAADSSVYSSGTAGVLRTDGNGEIVGVFTLPAETFTTGQRELRLVDSATNNELTATTIAKNTIINQGISLVSTNAQVNTRPLNTNFTSPIERTNVNREIKSNNITTARDPLSQSFFIDNIAYPYGVYITKIDLFFNTKANNASTKVYVQIREMENGLPTRKTIGDSTAYLNSSSINTSSNGTLPSTFVFDSPVYVLPGIDYCFSIIPEGNNPEFFVWTATLGLTDRAGGAGLKVSKQPAAGLMFTPSDDYTWSVRTTQDVKYRIYIANFTDASSTAQSYGAVFENASVASSNINYSSFISNISTLNPDRTSLSKEVRLADSAGSLSSFIQIENFENTSLTERKSVLSQATEVSLGAKSINLNVNLGSQSRNLSPVVDLERASAILLDYDINNKTSNILSGTATFSSSSNVVTGFSTIFTTEVNAGEYIRFGTVDRQVVSVTNNTHLIVATNFSTSGSNVIIQSSSEENPRGPYASKSRYISRRVELDNGFDANDLAVYLDVNRPAGTNIKVYYKILNSTDTDSFDDKFYHEMEIDGVPRITDTGSDYLEEKYTIPVSRKIGGTLLLSGTVTTTSSSNVVVGTSARFTEQLKIGDAITASAETKTITAIANNNYLVVDSNYSTSATGQAYKQLYDSVVYTTPSNSTYNGFKYFAIKVVFLSDNPAIVPKIKRLRVIALT